MRGRGATTTRRWMAMAVLVASAAALLATSPPGPPVSPVTGRVSSSLSMSADRPVARVRLAIDISDEALWSDDDEISIDSADVSIVARGRWPDAPTDARPTFFDIPTVHVRLADDGGELVESESLSHAHGRVDLLRACEPGLDCGLEIDAIIEWIDVVAGSSIAVEVEADARLEIVGLESPPPHAAVSLAFGDAVALPSEVRNAGIAGSAVVDADHPVATWRIRASADAGTLPGPVRWPTDGRLVFISRMEATRDTEDDRAPGRGLPIRLLIVDGEGVEQIGTPQRRPLFTTCEPDRPCEETVTVIAQWLGERGDEQVTVDWRLAGGIAYHGTEEPEADAEVGLAIVDQPVAGGAGPMLRETISGELTFDTVDGGLRAGRRLWLDVPAEAMDEALLGGPVPAIVGVLTVRGETSGSTGAQLRPLLLRLGPDEAVPAGFALAEPVPNGDPVANVVFPGIDCRAGRACRASLLLETGLLANDVEALEGQTVTLHWTFDVRLAYPEGTLLPGDLAITLRDDEP